MARSSNAMSGVGGGPRVTHIETRREKEDEDDDA